jgi:hypothetical protein
VRNAETPVRKSPIPLETPDAGAQDPQIPAKMSNAAGVLMEETVASLLTEQITVNPAAGAHTTEEKVTPQGSADSNSSDVEMSLASTDDKAAMAATIQELAKPSGLTKRKSSASIEEVANKDSLTGGTEELVEEKPKRRKRKGDVEESQSTSLSEPISLLLCSRC